MVQEEPEEVILIGRDGLEKKIRRGESGIPEKVAKYGRLPAGHAEGWLEAMGNLYVSFAECIKAKKDGTFKEDLIDFETINEGVEGLAFVEACIESNEKGNVWVAL